MQHGTRLAGQFRAGVAHGAAEVTWPATGHRLETQFKKGFPHGPATLTDTEDTTLWVGKFRSVTSL